MGDGLNNIFQTYAKATAEELKEGREWYPIAHREARKLAREFGVPVKKSSAILAVLSPNIQWGHNIEAAWIVFEGHRKGLDPESVTIGGWPDNKRKAFRILAGEPIKDHLRGLKVSAFWDNILRPKVSEAVTIDGHAYGIWRGEAVGVSGVPSKIFRPKWYQIIAEDYREAARRLGLRPLELQATTWLTWRRLLSEPEVGLEVAA